MLKLKYENDGLRCEDVDRGSWFGVDLDQTILLPSSLPGSSLSSGDEIS